MEIQRADRLLKLPPYLFAEIDRLREQVRAKGVDIIDLGVGDPDQPTPGFIVDALAQAAQDPSTHKYPAYSGMSKFRERAAAWCQRRFGLELDPQSEVITLIGSKEGIAHFPLAFTNPGDVVLVPNPAYPVYASMTSMLGAVPIEMPLYAENGFLPDLDAIPADVARRAKIMWLNYPNNPTAALASVEYYAKVVEFAKEYNIIVASDAAYTELAYDGVRPVSFLNAPGAKEVGIEFHSLSKTFNMTGWRLAFAVGHPELIRGLGQVKSQIDSGAFDAVQLAGMAALDSDQSSVAQSCAMYKGRRDVLVGGLQKLGLEVDPPRATFYVWARVPKGQTSAGFTMRLLEECGIVATPGNGFGTAGEGYIRFVLCADEARLAEAVDRMAKLGF